MSTKTRLQRLEVQHPPHAPGWRGILLFESDDDEHWQATDTQADESKVFTQAEIDELADSGYYIVCVTHNAPPADTP